MRTTQHIRSKVWKEKGSGKRAKLSKENCDCKEFKLQVLPNDDADEALWPLDQQRKGNLIRNSLSSRNSALLHAPSCTLRFARARIQTEKDSYTNEKKFEPLCSMPHFFVKDKQFVVLPLFFRFKHSTRRDVSENQLSLCCLRVISMPARASHRSK